MPGLHQLAEFGASSMEAMAVILITGRAYLCFHPLPAAYRSSRPVPLQRYKVFLGRALSLGLEFLVAANVIRTVGIGPTFRNLGLLGAIVLIRTALGWALVVEIEGHWPWQPSSGQVAK